MKLCGVKSNDTLNSGSGDGGDGHGFGGGGIGGKKLQVMCGESVKESSGLFTKKEALLKSKNLTLAREVST